LNYINPLEVIMERQVDAQYTADYKAQAVSSAESLGAAKAARKLGISVKTLANWIRISRDGARFVKGGKRRPVSDLEAENAPLRAENSQLRMERDVIKNSAKPRRASLAF
jgi:transposase